MNHLRILKCRLNVGSESVGLQYGLKILHFDTRSSMMLVLLV